MGFEVRFTDATEAHLYKHVTESPEIQPHFVVKILNESDPSLLYEDTVEGRYVFEGYLGGNPYRVIIEFAEEAEILVVYPVSAHRIRHKDYKRSMRGRTK